MSRPRTPTYRIIQDRLRAVLTQPDLDLETWLRARRSDGMSWLTIREVIHRKTGELVSHETLRTWAPDWLDEKE